jgi:hypothetical protein
MVKVDVREKDVERVGLKVIAYPVQAGAGVEDYAQLGQHEAGRLATVVGMIAGGA